MKLSDDIRVKYNEASRWWSASGCVDSEAEDYTIDLVYHILKEVGEVKFDDFNKRIDHPYLDREDGWKIGRIASLYIDESEDETIVARLVDGTEAYFEDFIELTNSSMLCYIFDSIGKPDWLGE